MESWTTQDLQESKMNFRTRVVHAAGRNIEDILTDKRVWVAVLGLLGAVNQWLGWEIPREIFITVEALIGALIVAWRE